MAGDQTWDEVLHAVEKDVAQTEYAFAHRDSPSDEASAGAPALLRLPSVEPVLPPLEDMSEVPVELRQRIIALQIRIDVLQHQLRDELSELRAAMAQRSVPQSNPLVHTETATPRLFDSRI